MSGSALQLQHLTIFPTIVHHASVYPCYAPQFRQLNGIWPPRPERCDLQGTKALVDAAKAKGRRGVKWPWGVGVCRFFLGVCCLESKDCDLFGGKVYVGNSKMPSFLARCIMVQDFWCSVATTTVREASNKEAVHMFAAILWRCPTLRRFMCFSGCPLQTLQSQNFIQNAGIQLHGACTPHQAS